MRQPSVLIAGAGLGGLSTAVFLGLHGVDTLVVERHPGLSTQPKARGQMPATMEALAAAGLAGRFADAAPPGHHAMKILIAQSMTGKVLHSFTEAIPDFSRFSPQPAGLVSQQRAERILADRAVELGVDIRFGTSLESFELDQDQVIVRLRDEGTGELFTVSARYLVAADGHKGTIRDAAGIGIHGRQRGTLVSAMFASFDADLRPALDGAAVGLWHLQNAALPHGNATVFTTDDPGRFVIGGGFGAADAEPERLTGHIRTAAGVPDLEVGNLDIAWTSSNTWITRVADSFRAGRVLLVGDAAHVMPPTGGQGGNAAVLDGWHLAWKLAAVLAGDAGDGLLDSHDAERRPYAEQLAEQQYANYVQRIDPSLAEESVAEIIDPVRGLFGYVCPSGAFVPSTGLPEGDLFEDPAEPTARPGARAPHAVLADGTSTRNLFGRDFVLLTSGLRESEWSNAAAGLRPSVRVCSLESGARTLYRLPPGGAVLVRPDGVIAWRSADPAGLAGALREILR
jgi:2-polyprenyl-6-methoxyphenol hydroxylase-like FAD-dependent oxidoreductase